ncbi:MAG: hypothetical protein V1736_06030, partial [Pseudomonadota bacterium]
AAVPHIPSTGLILQHWPSRDPDRGVYSGDVGSPSASYTMIGTFWWEALTRQFPIRVICDIFKT